MTAYLAAKEAGADVRVVACRGSKTREGREFAKLGVPFKPLFRIEEFL
jgi:hypothetical protein